MEKEAYIPVYYVSSPFLIYTLIYTVIARTFAIQDIIKGFLAFPLLIIVPFLLGRIITEKVSKKVAVIDDIISYFYLSWVFGALMLATFYTILQVFHQYVIIRNSHLMIISIVVANELYAVVQGYHKRLIKIENCPTIKEFILLTLYLSVLFYISRLKLPFPYIGYDFVNVQSVYLILYRAMNTGFFLERRLGWLSYILPSCLLPNLDPLAIMWWGPLFQMFMYSLGMYAFTYLMLKDKRITICSVVFSMIILVDNGMFFNNYFTNRPEYSLCPSCTLFSILPFTLYLIEKSLMKKEIIHVGITKFLKYFVFIIVIGLISLIFADIDLLAYSLLGLDPILVLYYKLIALSMLTLSLFLIITLIITFGKNNKNNNCDEWALMTMVLAIIVPALILFVTFHETEPILLFPIIYLYIIVSWLVKIVKDGDKSILKYLNCTLALLVFIYIVVQLCGIISIKIEPISKIIYPTAHLIKRSFIDKAHSFYYGMSTIPIILLAIGISVTATRKTNSEQILSFMTIVTIFLYFFPDPFSIRVSAPLTIFCSIVIGYSVIWIFDEATFLLSRIKERIFESKTKDRSKLIIGLLHATLAIIIVVLPMYQLLTIYCDRYWELPRKNIIHSKLTTYEWQIAMWFKKNTGHDARIISDPFTMFVINGLADKISLVRLSMHIHELPEHEQYKIYLIKKLFLSENSTEAYSIIRKIANFSPPLTDLLYMDAIGIQAKNITLYIVLTARTVSWIRSSTLELIYVPVYRNIPEKILLAFSDEKYFKLVYQGDYFYIWMVKL